MTKHIKNYKDFVNISEYDRSGFDSKYRNLPKERKDKIMDYSIERQKLNGVSFTSNEDHKLFITPSDITFSTTPRYDNNDKFMNTLKNAAKICSGKYKGGDGEIDLYQLEKDFPKFQSSIDLKMFDKHLIGIKPRIEDFTLYVNIRNVVSDSNGDETVEGYLNGTLVKLEDKYNPAFEFNIDSIRMNFGSDIKILPTTQKDNVKFIKELKNMIINNYNNPRDYFHITNVNIDRNSFYK